MADVEHDDSGRVGSAARPHLRRGDSPDALHPQAGQEDADREGADQQDREPQDAPEPDRAGPPSEPPAR